jgi:hypothetical protein
MISRRLSGLVLGLAFVFATTAPLGLQHCPAMSAHIAMHGAHHMPAHSMPAHHTPDQDHSQQCCLGACCCTAAVTAPTGRLVSLPVVPVRVVKSAAVAQHVDTRPTSPDDVVLPPPLGPPTALPV